MSDMVKVCVRIPHHRRGDLLKFAEELRQGNPDPRGPGWDSKAIHRIAREHFGGLREMFEHHGWPERGSDMMRKVQKRVTETYGSIENFVSTFGRS